MCVCACVWGGHFLIQTTQQRDEGVENILPVPLLTPLSPSPNDYECLSNLPLQRDIPMPLVTSGVEKGNLRELALARMAALGLRCRWVNKDSYIPVYVHLDQLQADWRGSNVVSGGACSSRAHSA